MTWLILDGVIHDEWTLPFEFALKNDLDFHVPSLGRFQLNNRVRVIFEAPDVRHASPALIGGNMAYVVMAYSYDPI